MKVICPLFTSAILGPSLIHFTTLPLLSSVWIMGIKIRIIRIQYLIGMEH